MKKHLALVALALTLQSCPSQDKEAPQVPLPKEYESCCGVQPVDFKLGNESIYMPNVFTPNGDGINDLFYPFVSGEVSEVQGFTIFSAEGDTILFQRPTFVYDRLNEFAWNGKRMDGSLYRGKFKYGMRVITKSMQLRLLNGEACSVLCEPGTKELKTKKSCFYPSQAGKLAKAGKLDDTLPNGENDCLR